MSEPHPDLLSVISGTGGREAAAADHHEAAEAPLHAETAPAARGEEAETSALEGIDPVASVEAPETAAEPHVVPHHVAEPHLVEPHVGEPYVAEPPAGDRPVGVEPSVADAPLFTATTAAIAWREASGSVAAAEIDGLPATRGDLAAFRRELQAQVDALESHLWEKLQFMGWALLAGVAVLMAATAAIVELL